jgi:hypothetical protein
MTISDPPNSPEDSELDNSEKRDMLYELFEMENLTE